MRKTMWIMLIMFGIGGILILVHEIGGASEAYAIIGCMWGLVGCLFLAWRVLIYIVNQDYDDD